MDFHLVSAPYDSGHRDFRMGRGPGALLDSGVAARILAAGHSVSLIDIVVPNGPPSEIQTGFAVCRLVAGAVHEARDAGAFPIVLTGNCLTQVGVTAGLGMGTGLVWLDAHGDLNTPETTRSGFLDGMAMAVVGGWCWRALADGVDGFVPVSPEHMVLVGARDLDRAEVECIEQRGITHIAPRGMNEASSIERVVACLRGCNQVSIHLDLDVLDPGVCAVNALQADDGLTERHVAQLVRALVDNGQVGALTISAYDPSVDAETLTPGVVQRLLSIFDD